MIFPHAAENRKIRGICPCPAIREGGHARRGTSRQRAHKPRLRAPHRRIPPLLTLPQHIYYSTFRPKRKGFSFIIIVFCFGRGKCCFRSKRMRSVLPRNSSSSMGERCEGVEGATAKPPRRVRRRETLCVTKKFKPHGSAMRRSRGGDRKAPSSRPQTRNHCATKKCSWF